MSKITIPPEALAAAKKAYIRNGTGLWPGSVEAACLAMLSAWPGMSQEKVWEGKDMLELSPVIILPLNQEPET